MKIDELLEQLKLYMSTELDKNTVSISIFINCEGIQMTTRHRTPEQLKKSGISMRNINGDFIK